MSNVCCVFGYEDPGAFSESSSLIRKVLAREAGFTLTRREPIHRAHYKSAPSVSMHFEANPSPQ